MLLQGVEFKCKHSCPDAEAPDTTHGSMIVSGARFMRPLEAVGWQPPLAAAVPHGKQLRSLTLQACDFLLPGAAAAALAPQQWAQLRALELSDCGGLGGMDDTLQELLTCASQLESLRWARPGVYGEQHGPHQRLLAFPTAIFSHPTLTSAELLSMFDENWDQLQLQLPQPPDPRETCQPCSASCSLPLQVCTAATAAAGAAGDAAPLLLPLVLLAALLCCHCCSAASLMPTGPLASKRCPAPRTSAPLCTPPRLPWPLNPRRPGGIVDDRVYWRPTRPGSCDQPA